MAEEITERINEGFDLLRGNNTGETSPYSQFVDWFEWKPTTPSFVPVLRRREVFIVTKITVFEDGIIAAPSP